MYKKNSYGPHFMALFIIAINGVMLPAFCSEERPIDREVKREFFNAAERGDIQKMEQLLRGAPHLVHHRVGPLLYMPLHYAAESGQQQAVGFLLRHGAHVQAQCDYGKTALHVAAESGHLNVVRDLLKHASWLRDVKNRRGETALHVAAEAGQRDVVEYFLDCGADGECRDEFQNTPLAIIASLRMGDEQFVRDYQDIFVLLLRRGARIDTQDDDLNTLLHRAAESSGCLALVRFLVENGMPINVQNKQGQTPLFKAIFQGHVAVTKFFVDHGAVIDKCSRTGTRPIHCAFMSFCSEIADDLVKAGADIYAANKEGKTPLLAACDSVYYPREGVRWVLQFGVPLQNDEEIKKLHEMQKNINGLDARKVIQNRRGEIEDVLLGEIPRVTGRLQAVMGWLVRHLWLPRVLTDAVDSSEMRSDVRGEKPAMLRDVPDDVIKIIIECMVTPDLPGLEEIGRDAS